MFDVLIDNTVQQDGTKRSLYADSAYRSEEKEAQLAILGITSQICEKGVRNHPLTDVQKASNQNKSKVRARVEHVFGSQAQRGGHIVRTIGLIRAQVKIGLMNLVYNMVRLGQLLKYTRKNAYAVA